MEDFKDKVSNTYVIRHRLASLSKAPLQNHYEYYVGKFKVVIFTHKMGDHSNHHDPHDCITKHDILQVDLYEVHKADPTKRLWDTVRLSEDERFKDYEPIHYMDMYPGRRTATGHNMPLNYLCELIRYLHKLEKLSVFL